MAKNSIIVGLLIVVVGLVLLLVTKDQRERESVEIEAPEIEVAPSVEIATPLGIELLVDEMLAAPEFASAALGFCLIDDQGEIVVDRNAGLSFIPASTLKTLTGATALKILGPEFRFETTLLASGAISGAGELPGDLVIRGSGDPTLAPSDLTDWVAELKRVGITKITGAVVGDATFFPEAIAGEFWNWGDVGNGYGSPAAGLNLNHNRFVATFRPGEEIGAVASLLDVSPPVPGVSWVNRVTTATAGSGDGVMIYGGPGATQIFLSGSVPLGGENFEVLGAVPDPAMFAATELHRQLREAGVEIGGQPRTKPFGQKDGSELEVKQLLSHKSPPLAEIVQHLNEVSDNHEAECLYRLLAIRGGRPADEVIRAHWLPRGLDLSDCRMVDGSGLSRANFISAVDLTRLQHLARRGPQGEIYYQSLNGYFDGALRWKGGAMSSIRSYTGYVTGKSGREYTFSMMFNHYLDGDAVSQWRDRIARELLELE